MILKRLTSFFLDTLEVVVFSIAIFLFIYLLVLQPHKIKGDSMVPNFLNGEYLLTDKLTYRFGEPQRGDVIVFEAPGTNGEEFIKRIIGLPGESILIKQGKIYINGKLLSEAYIPSTSPTDSGNFLKEGQETLIPNDKFVVFGDNRRASSDSRAWGFVAKDKITGRAWVIYWPISKVGVIEKAAFSLN